MVRHGFIVLAAIASLIGCAHYEGLGPYRTASDYGTRATRAPVAQYQPHGAFKLRWPLRHIHINQGFHSAHNPRHEGIDLGGVLGTPVLAAHAGRVIYTGHGFRGYGNMVLLEFNKHWATLYAHLNHITVHEGQILSAGDLLGTMGKTGDATGVHLHFELMRNRLPVNPLAYLPSKPTMFAKLDPH